MTIRDVSRTRIYHAKRRCEKLRKQRERLLSKPVCQRDWETAFTEGVRYVLTHLEEIKNHANPSTTSSQS